MSIIFNHKYYFSGSSQSCFNYFKEKYEEFKPIKKLTVFFNNENFLLTEYNISNSFVHMVLENDCNELMELTGLNCGYNGTGPNYTRRILEILNVPNPELIILKKHITLLFNDERISIDTSTPFFERFPDKTSFGFALNDYTSVDIILKQIYIVAPEMYSFNSFLSAINLMEPVEFEYEVGSNSYLMGGKTIEDVFGEFRPYKLHSVRSRGVNLIIRGKKFDLICFIDKRNEISTINSTYLHIFKKNLWQGFYTSNLKLTVNKGNFLEFIKNIIFSIKKPCYEHNIISIDSNGGNYE